MQKLVKVMCYLAVKAARPSVRVWFVLVETSGCGPLSWVLSGKLFRAYLNLSKRKDRQGGVTAATDVEGHICGRGEATVC